nr:nuclear transport factor 2 family protein [uncultured Fluviicola sp.]
MTPKEVLEKWIHLFNEADGEKIAELYEENAINHQVANEPVIGKAAIREMFTSEFASAKMVCIPENIFEDGEWAILEWKDPKGMRGCGFFHVIDDKIVFQRGYWDKLSFHKLYDIPLNVH